MTVDGLQFYSSAAGSLRLYDAANADCSGTAAGSFAINYNGTSMSSTDAATTWTAGQSIDLTSVSRYIAVPYSNAATTTPSVKIDFTNSTATCTKSQIIVTDKGGKVLTAASACVSSTTTTITATDTATLGGSGSFVILFSRAGDSSGGIRVWQSVLTK